MTPPPPRRPAWSSATPRVHRPPVARSTARRAHSGGHDPERIYRDKLSGTSTREQRPGLGRAARLRPARRRHRGRGIDRLGRNAAEVMTTIRELRDREIVLRSLREGIDTANATGRMVAGVLASSAELELELGRERRAVAREARRARGQAIGRPKALDESKAALARRMHASGEPVSMIAADARRQPCDGVPRAAEGGKGGLMTYGKVVRRSSAQRGEALVDLQAAQTGNRQRPNDNRCRCRSGDVRPWHTGRRPRFRSKRNGSRCRQAAAGLCILAWNFDDDCPADWLAFVDRVGDRALVVHDGAGARAGQQKPAGGKLTDRTGIPTTRWSKASPAGVRYDGLSNRNRSRRHLGRKARNRRADRCIYEFANRRRVRASRSSATRPSGTRTAASTARPSTPASWPQDKLDNVKKQLAQGQSPSSLRERGRETFGVVAASGSSRHDLKPRTRAEYENLLCCKTRRGVIVMAQHRRSVDRRDVRSTGRLTDHPRRHRRLGRQARGAGKSASTVRHHYFVVRQVLSQAVADGRLMVNPADHVKLPSERSGRWHAGRGGRSRHVPDRPPGGRAGRRNAVAVHVMVHLAAWSGLRAAELAGLCKSAM